MGLRFTRWWNRLSITNKIAFFGAACTILAAIISPLITWVLPERNQTSSSSGLSSSNNNQINHSSTTNTSKPQESKMTNTPSTANNQNAVKENSGTESSHHTLYSQETRGTSGFQSSRTIKPSTPQTTPASNAQRVYKSPEYDSNFGQDITYKDGSPVAPGQVIHKVWEITNIGTKPWEDFLVKNTEANGLEPTQETYQIERVEPGHSIKIAVDLKVTAKDGSAYSYWKIIDSYGNLVFPDKKGIYCQVIVQNQ